MQHLIPGAQLVTRAINEFIGSKSKNERKKKVSLSENVMDEVVLMIETVKKSTSVEFIKIDGKKWAAAIDSFSNLLICQVVSSRSGEEVKNFLFSKIECIYRLPRALHSDNAKVFTGGRC